MKVNNHNETNKTIAIIMCLCIVAAFTGCKKNPESSIVKNKDMDKLIDQAGNIDSDGVGMDNLSGKYESYKNTIKDDSLDVTVNVDAEVCIPSVDKMSVIRVSQQKFTQKLIDTIKAELVGDTKLYDGSSLHQRTKKSIEEEISSLRDEMNSLTGDGSKEAKKDFQKRIDSLQSEYDSVSKEVKLTDYPSDGKLASVSAKYKQDKNDEFYSWMNDLIPDGEIFFGVSDGADDSYMAFSAMNSEDYSNFLSFRVGNHGYEFVQGVGSTGGNSTRWKGDSIKDDTQDMNYVVFPEDKVTLTREEAIAKADSFLEKTGITDFKLYSGDIYTESVDVRYECNLNGNPCRTYYILKYMRNIDGVFVTETGESKNSEQWNDNKFTKKDWPEESIEFRINDSGIVGFDYNSPIKTNETVVEASSLKSFEEIKEQFEKMVVISNAQEKISTQIDIDKVVMGYARISEADSYDTGLLVPVWDFLGTSSNKMIDKTELAYYSVITINAIDGSVIDRSLGY